MRKIVLDSCILVHFLTKNKISEQIENDLQISASDCVPIISSVTKGELTSFAKQRKWGKNKLENLNMLLNNLIIVDIAAKDMDLMNAYALLMLSVKEKLRVKMKSYCLGRQLKWVKMTYGLLLQLKL